MEKVYPDGHRFQQDNDPKHTSNLALDYLDSEDINYWRTPSESPDLNPIEMLWAEMKYFLRKNIKPLTQDQLIAGIKSFWDTVDKAKCNRYINHINKVLPIVIERGGKASGH